MFIYGKANQVEGNKKYTNQNQVKAQSMGCAQWLDSSVEYGIGAEAGCETWQTGDQD